MPPIQGSEASRAETPTPQTAAPDILLNPIPPFLPSLLFSPPNLDMQPQPPRPAATVIARRLKHVVSSLVIIPPAPQLAQPGLQRPLDGIDDLVADHGEELEGVARSARGEDEVRAVRVRAYEEIAGWPGSSSAGSVRGALGVGDVVMWIGGWRGGRG